MRYQIYLLKSLLHLCILYILFFFGGDYLKKNENEKEWDMKEIIYTSILLKQLKFYWNQIYLLKSLLHLYILYILFFGGIIFKRKWEKRELFAPQLKFYWNWINLLKSLLYFYIWLLYYVFFLELFLKEGEKGVKEII